MKEFESKSVLKFTCELSRDDVLPFLDVLVQRWQNQYLTSMYRKPTNSGQTLHADSESPTRYKARVIRAFIKRAIRTCSSNNAMHEEFVRVKQLLVNNGYRNRDVDSEIRRQLDQERRNVNSQDMPKNKTHHVY